MFVVGGGKTISPLKTNCGFVDGDDGIWYRVQLVGILPFNVHVYDVWVCPFIRG